MMEYRLLIVDSDNEYLERTQQFLRRIPGIKVVGAVHDGSLAMQLAATEKPDIILLEPLLPGMDGLSFMRTMQKQKDRPLIICVSQFYSSISVEIARRNGACYFAYKPIAPESLATIILECAAMNVEMQRADCGSDEIIARSESKRRIHAIMRELGFSSRFCGSEYIAELVAMAAEAPMMLHNLSSGLYRTIAEQLHTSVPCIERSIRTAIAAANVNGRLSEAIGAVPTNKTCIRYILRMLSMQE